MWIQGDADADFRRNLAEYSGFERGLLTFVTESVITRHITTRTTIQSNT